MNTRRTPDLDDLNPDQREALLQFKERHGRYWKQELNNQWMRAAAGPLLQQVRNNFGPSWLAKLKD